MEWIVAIVVFVSCIVVLVLVSKRWGRATTEAKANKKKVKEMKDDQEISSKPYVDKPFSRMRRKE